MNTIDNNGDSESQDDSWMNEYFINTVSHNQTIPAKQANVNIDLGPNNTKTKFKIDTGSSVNTLPIKSFELLNVSLPLQTTDAKLTSYSGDRIRVHGKVTLTCRYKNATVNTTFYVVNNNAPPLLSLQTSVDLGLIALTYAIEQNQPITKECVMSEYSDLFKGIGTLPGKSKLYLRDNAVPVIAAPRRVPEALKSRLKQELDQMVKHEIITPVTEPTDWVHPIVVVEKSNGALRVCLDAKPLNDAISITQCQR